ncbi:hypothetical protein RN001_009865 [Aquatica leii]|uniref:O-acyltransferase WSD1 C-terminal domain-containing protein n=1 Tax=Aquatica leii TaxID=1421715 RepID=A0AAN7P5J3_9COLE|nr:hypothetical protein RN001_009865 [Aquatica leii]
MSLSFLVECSFWIALILNIFEVKKSTNNAASILLFIVLYPILVLAMTVIFATFPLFWILKQLVGVVLKIQHGSDFNGLVEGLDVISVCDQNRSVTQLLLVFECDTSYDSEEWFDLVKNAVKNVMIKNSSKFLKLFSALDNYLGYFYMKKISLNLDDCVKKLQVLKNKETSIKKEELIDLISNCYYDEFPFGGKALWDVFVGTQPVLWNIGNNNAKKKYYPVVVRIDPGVVNNVCLSSIWNYFCLRSDVTSIDKHSCNLKSFLISMWKGFYTFKIFPSALFSNLILKGRDRNALCRGSVEEEVLGINTDWEGLTFTKMKNIQSNLLSTTVEEIMLTAYTASLNEYIEKNSTNYVKEITAIMPVLRNTNLSPQSLLENQGIYNVLLKLPITIENLSGYNEKTPLLSRLHMIKQLHKSTRTSLKLQAFIFVTKYFCSVLPKPIVTFLLSKVHATTSVSISKPIKKMSFCDGKIVNVDCCLWLAHTNGSHAQFSVMSCDDRLQLGFNAYKLHFRDHTDAQNVVDGVCKYIDLLEKEVAYTYE